MKKHILALLSLYFAVSPCFAAGGAALSLKEAIDIAYDNNNEILAAEKYLESSNYSLKSSYGSFLPRVNVEGKVTRIDSPMVMDLTGIRTAMISADLATLKAAGQTNPAALAAFRNNLNAALPEFISELQKDQYANLSANVVQPIFMGGQLLLNTKAKKAEREIYRIMFTQAANKVAGEVCTSYCRVLLARDVIKIREEIYAGMKEHSADADKLFTQGVIAKAVRLKADVALAEAERELSKARRDLELANLLLDNSVGAVVSGRPLSTPLQLTAGDKTAGEYAKAALELNPQKNIAANKKLLLGLKQKSAGSNFLPSVYAFGKCELYKEDLTMLEPEWAAGVAAKINIFKGGSDAMELKAARKEVEAAREQLLFIDNSLKTLVSKYHNEMLSAREQYESLKKSAELAKENLKLFEESFKEGMASSTDVIDARLTYGKVKIEQSRSLFDFETAFVNLLITAGRGDTITEYFTEETR